MAKRRRRAGRGRNAELRSTLRLGAVFLILVGINVYVFFFRGGTSLSDIQREVTRARIEARPERAVAAGRAEAEAEPAGGRLVERSIQRGDSLHKVLVREGLTPPEVEALTRALEPLLDFRTIREGQQIRLRFDDEGRVEAFELRASPSLLYRVERDRDGKLQGHKSQARTAAGEVPEADPPGPGARA